MICRPTSLNRFWQRSKTKYSEMINRLNSLPLEQKIGQLFFIGIPGPEIDQVAQDLIDEVTPGGFCLFARNLKDTGQVKSLTGMLDHLSPVTPFLSIDQEGG